MDLQSAVVKCGLDNDPETLDQRINVPMLVSANQSVRSQERKMGSNLT